MLALCVVLADRHAVPSLIFDEIDAGVGGAVAHAVGARLARLAARAQVLVVTHHPQVAALATHHCRIVQAQRSRSRDHERRSPAAGSAPRGDRADAVGGENHRRGARGRRQPARRRRGPAMTAPDVPAVEALGEDEARAEAGAPRA